MCLQTQQSQSKDLGLWAPLPQGDDIHTTDHNTAIISDPTTFTGTNQKTTQPDPRAIEFTAITNPDSFTFLYTPYSDKQTLTHVKLCGKYRKYTQTNEKRKSASDLSEHGGVSTVLHGTHALQRSSEANKTGLRRYTYSRMTDDGKLTL